MSRGKVQLGLMALMIALALAVTAYLYFADWSIAGPITFSQVNGLVRIDGTKQEKSGEDSLVFVVLPPQGHSGITPEWSVDLTDSTWHVIDHKMNLSWFLPLRWKYQRLKLEFLATGRTCPIAIFAAKWEFVTRSCNRQRTFLSSKRT